MVECPVAAFHMLKRGAVLCGLLAAGPVVRRGALLSLAMENNRLFPFAHRGTIYDAEYECLQNGAHLCAPVAQFRFQKRKEAQS